MINPLQIPLSLYIHIPWCIRKCPYCDFNSHQAGAEAIPEKQYFEALRVDIEQELETSLSASHSVDLSARVIDTVFIGGGTPSLMSADFYHRLFDYLRQVLQLSSDCEITLEANPGSLEQASFSGFRQAGINRLSIGVQSFDDAALSALGRVHDARTARAAFDSAREAGFDNVNIDLMYGLSGQTVEAALSDLTIASSLNPEHLSWYQLTIEPNTLFYSKTPVLPPEPVIEAIGEAGLAALKAAGFERYEISAFSKKHRRCRHNLNYWNFGDYIGIGAGAHGKLSTKSGLIRRAKRRMPVEYMNSTDKTATHQGVSVQELPLEFMLNALRLTNGFELSTFCQRTGLSDKVIQQPLDALIADKLLVKTNNNGAVAFAPTERGLQYHNNMLALFLAE